MTTTKRLLATLLPVVGLGLVLAPKASTQNQAQDSFRDAVRVDGTPIANAAEKRLSYADAVDAIRNSVVLITSRKRPRVPAELVPYLADPFFRRMFPQYDPNLAPEQSGLGSGFVVTSDGYIITNNHVITGADELEVTITALEQTFPARIIGSDPGTDIALIKIEAENLPVATLADSDNLRVGDVALAMGSPLGFSDTVTMGIISALDRDTSTEKRAGILGDGGYEQFIQTDASINGGNSGGPLVDGLGRVVGVNTFIISGNGSGGGNIGLGFAVPSNLAIRIAMDLADDGKVDRGFLGVNMQSLDRDMAASFGLDRPDGALVNTVFEGTPAFEAGLRQGDLILTVDGEAVDDSGSLRVHISSLRPGDKTIFGVLRRGEKIKVPATIGKKPDARQASSMRPSGPAAGQEPVEARAVEGGYIPGVEVVDLTREQRRRIGLRQDDPGVLVAAVDPNSDAARKGLRAGDLIIEVGFSTIPDTKALGQAIAEAKGNLRVRVLSRTGSYFLVLEKGE